MHPGGGGIDRLSALPDDVLVLILLRLDTSAAGRTSILSHRWRRLWALLPELRFPADANLRLVAAALAAHEAAISHLDVQALDAAPESVEACLALAAGRLSGRLVFRNRVSVGNAGGDGVSGEIADGDGEGEAGEAGGFGLPCLYNATAVSLDLGFLGLAMPTTGVFGRLTELSLERIRFRGSWELGDAVSSPRCPCLQKLNVNYARGLGNLAIHSESLLQLNLHRVDGLQQLTIVAQALNKLHLVHCSGADCPLVAHISTPQQLDSLAWMDLYCSTSIQLGNWPLLENLNTIFYVYASHDSGLNHGFLRLLKQFQFIDHLHIMLEYLKDIGNFQYAMEDLTMLPCLTNLSILVRHNGHAFGASLFHVLRICSDLRMLVLSLHDEVPDDPCPPGCVCDQQPSDWKTEELTLNCLEAVVIEMEGSDHQVAFVKRLFTWAVVLKIMCINFDCSMSECKVMELRQTLSNFAGPETCVKFYMYQNESVKFSGTKYLLAP